MDEQQKRFFTTVVIITFIISGAAGFLAGGLGTSYWSKLAKPATIQSANQEQAVDLNAPNTPQEEHVISVVKTASPAVVSIIISKNLPVIQQNPLNDFFNNWPFGDFFSPSPQQSTQPQNNGGTQLQEIGGGTGFIISSDGLILTNKHVVADTQAEYTVLTNDGKKYPAKVLARDPVQDLAVIKIEKTGLPTLKLGDSDKLEIGQSVIAIGNALGEFSNTVSVGVVSGLQRSIDASMGLGSSAEQLQNVIQTDAAINPGNSGGPLLNLSGEVIGIDTAIAQGAQNIGFALPINLAKRDIKQVENQGKITYPYLGVRYVLITPDIKQQKNLSVDYGALILSGANQGEPAIIAGSPAEKAGLVENDIILEADGQKIDESNHLAQIIQNHNIGDTITLKVLHQGQEKTVKVVLGER